jgi:nucleotide-binding universal stress UspA family protein
MTGAAARRPVIVWVTAGTWQASVDAASSLAPAGASIVLLHVTPADLADAAHGAYLGLFGRGQPDDDPGPRVAEIAAASATDLLDAAASRLGRPCERAERRGRPEQEVVAAAAGAGLLVMARDGDQSRLGPRSLGKAARFVVDHAPCPVLLVWPGSPPDTATIPPPPPPHHRPGRRRH